MTGDGKAGLITEPAVRRRAVREPPLQADGFGLGCLEYGFEDGGGGTSEGVDRGESGFVGYGGDEVFGLLFVQSPGVEADGHDGGWLDKCRYLLVEAGHAGGGMAGGAPEHRF